MRAHHKKRLLKLARMLVADAKRKKGIKFDLNELATSKLEDTPINCGTKACAMGLAALSGEFKRAGLFYNVQEGLDDFRGAVWRINTTWKGREVYYDTAASKLFGISESAARYLFAPHRYSSRVKGAKGELRVAARIREMVKTGRTDRDRVTSENA